ncbi:BTB/POZ domain-containing protein 18 [Platysternon megacephalum]|uniref:BTB/POZ domain-containing protein 18 n=1 Tax=Platysternon megacephalum TaxID=55544 RepID=A0A4D9DUD5_9SAUR|nr:BTB/POZ domain-containing protein 18 [Platysternon megacephalum]
MARNSDLAQTDWNKAFLSQAAPSWFRTRTNPTMLGSVSQHMDFDGVQTPNSKAFCWEMLTHQNPNCLWLRAGFQDSPDRLWKLAILRFSSEIVSGLGLTPLFILKFELTERKGKERKGTFLKKKKKKGLKSQMKCFEINQTVSADQI